MCWKISLIDSDAWRLSKHGVFRMKFAIVGAGAIGAYIGAKLWLSGEEVSLIARGDHLKCMQANGIQILDSEGDFVAYPKATDDYNEVGPVDFVFLTVKAHSLIEVVDKLGPLMGPKTSVVSAQNGIPWWYFFGHGGAWDGTQIKSVDPEGIISKFIDSERIIGCILYLSTEIVKPGVIRFTEGDRLAIGELDGSNSERCKDLAGAIKKTGLRCPIRGRIREDLWVKLLGNVAFNPISALTRSTLDLIISDRGVASLARAVMQEADSVARALGVKVPISIEQRMAGASKVGPHKTSMLQDVERGRKMELDSILGAVVELGDKLGVSVNNTRYIYSCAKLLERNLIDE